jgi:hypothetical protein
VLGIDTLGSLFAASRAFRIACCAMKDGVNRRVSDVVTSAPGTRFRRLRRSANRPMLE